MTCEKACVKYHDVIDYGPMVISWASNSIIYVIFERETALKRAVLFYLS